MKVIAINGSPREKGNTYTAINLAAEQLRAEGIDVEIVHIGNKTIRGCQSCGFCYKSENNLCAIKDDVLNETVLKMRDADGIIIGSPVYYSGIAGQMKSFLDRAFYTSSRYFAFKVCAAVCAVRRGGGTSTFHQLNNFFNLGGMVITPTQYWGVIHGAAAGEAEQDPEGIQVMQSIGRNMAWLIKTFQREKEENPPPAFEKKLFTNFIRKM